MKQMVIDSYFKTILCCHEKKLEKVDQVQYWVRVLKKISSFSFEIFLPRHLYLRYLPHFCHLPRAQHSSFIVFNKRCKVSKSEQKKNVLSIFKLTMKEKTSYLLHQCQVEHKNYIFGIGNNELLKPIQTIIISPILNFQWNSKLYTFC